MGDKMETFSARLASFDSVLPSINSRASTSRNVQPMAWPYDSPSPEQLAHAGFFFNPYDTNPDNTTCFLCRRALDGWEEGDDPITEHLKHSPDCAWAIIMDIQQKTSNPAEIEDPTSAAIVEARRTTFAIGWPHDGKPGWACQSDKMVEAGWYFCPNEESPDLASCPYCKLSLDGWEETDNPFEEHYRRSSDCSFFVFALPAGKSTKKTTRAKKPRASKTSRLSTQSVMTTTSEAPTIEDDAMDTSVLSQATVKKAKGTKKSTRSRTKKGKKEEPHEVHELMEPEQTEEKEPEPERPKRATRGTKRGSEAIAQDLPPVISKELHATPDPEEPSPKRRATEIRRISHAHEDIQPNYLEEAPVDVAISPVMSKKGRKGAKKSTATKTRKTSSASASSRTTKGRIPDDSILEAAIEADLARNMQESEPFEFHYKDEERESARFRKQSIPASTEVVPTTQHEIKEVQNTRAEPPVNDPEPIPDPEVEPEAEPAQEVTAEPKAKKPTKRKASAKKSKKEKAPAPTEPEPESELVEPMHSEPNLPAELEVSRPKSIEKEEIPPETMEVEPNARHGSLVAVEIENNNQQPELHGEDTEPPVKKQGKKTVSKGKKHATLKRTEDNFALNEVENEVSGITSQHALPDAGKTQGSGSKRKSKEVEEAVMIVGEGERNSISAGSAHEEAVEQPQIKAKRGRPAKDVERNSQENTHSENQAVEANRKRGRPSKQTARNDQAEQDTEERSKQSRRPSKSALPLKNTQRYSDLPKDGHRAQSFIKSVAQESFSPRTSAPDTTHSRRQERTPSPSPQSSDAENRPPSTRPHSARPPIVSPPKALPTRVPLAASTPIKSPSKRQLGTGFLSSSHSWKPMDIDELLGSVDDKENRDFTINQGNFKEILTSPEKKMTVEEWIHFNAKNGEERLRQECERLISIFEREGGRAMRALEGIECID